MCLSAHGVKDGHTDYIFELNNLHFFVLERQKQLVDDGGGGVFDCNGDLEVHILNRRSSKRSFDRKY